MKTVPIRNLIPCISLIVCFTWTGCQDNSRDLPTRGKLTMISSEDIFPVIDKEVKEFGQMYEQAHITHLQSTTRDAIVQLLNDSVKLVTSPRQLNEEERAVIKKYKLQVDTFKIAYDAALVLVNEKNSLTRFTVEELRGILLGTITKWRELGEKNNVGRIVVALGDPNTGMSEYLKKRLAGSQPIADVVAPCATSMDVIDYVSSHSNAIGFVSSGWITETPPKTRIADIGDPEYKRDSASTTLEYFPPLQAHVYRNYYPLRRTLYIFSRKAGTGVGIGFAAFVTGAQGQKLFLKNGLVPATMPVRLVQLHTSE